MGIKYCNYGCGQEAKYQFKNGKWCCSKHFSSCPYMKNRNKVSNINRNYITIDKMKRAWEKRKTSPYYIKQQKCRGKKQSVIMKKLWNIGVYDNDEYREKLSIGIKKVWKDPNSIYNSDEWRNKQSENTKKLFKNEKFLQKYKIAMMQTPNKLEKLMMNILEEMNLAKYKFVGDHSLWIGGKNPDFINVENKKIIEFFGDYWHSEKITGRDMIEEEFYRKSHFKKYGFDTLVIWESELKNINKLKIRIRGFVK